MLHTRGYVNGFSSLLIRFSLNIRLGRITFRRIILSDLIGLIMITMTLYMIFGLVIGRLVNSNSIMRFRTITLYRI